MKKFLVVKSDYTETFGHTLKVVGMTNTYEEAQVIVDSYNEYWNQEDSNWKVFDGNLALMLYNNDGEYINIEIQEIEVDMPPVENSVEALEDLREEILDYYEVEDDNDTGCYVNDSWLSISSIIDFIDSEIRRNK